MKVKKCPKCEVPLDLVMAGDDIWTTDYLICPKCDGTYNLNEDYDIEIVKSFLLKGE